MPALYVYKCKETPLEYEYINNVGSLFWTVIYHRECTHVTEPSNYCWVYAGTNAQHMHTVPHTCTYAHKQGCVSTQTRTHKVREVITYALRLD